MRFSARRTGLYDMRINDDINVFCGCGLGGTSLVNANVSLPAEPRVFDDPRWPEEFRADVATRLQTGYKLAQEMLTPSPYPDNFPALPKLQALEKSAQSLNEKFYRPPINVTFKDGVNPVGVQQNACTLCGDCVTGCNYAAKNTVLMNYLPDARNHGAEIFTQVGVRFLEQKDGLWVIHYQVLDSGREKFDTPTQFLTANMVVLAAGMLGSSGDPAAFEGKGPQRFRPGGPAFHRQRRRAGVRLRHRRRHRRNRLRLSSAARDEIPWVHALPESSTIGCSRNWMTAWSLRKARFPAPWAGLFPPRLAAVAPWAGTNLEPGVDAFLEERERELESLVCGPYHGAVQNTQTYLVMSHDDADGHMSLENDRLRLHWPGAGIQPGFTRVNDRLDQATKALGGIFETNPLWSDLTNHNLITVHPLGGCTMAADASAGRRESQGPGVLRERWSRGLRQPLCVRRLRDAPISGRQSALDDLGCCREMLRAHRAGPGLDHRLRSLQSVQPPPSPAVTVGLRFTEAMKGFFSTKVTDDFAKGSAQGKQDNSSFAFILTVIADDLNRLLTDPDHPGRMVGTVTAPALSAKPLTVSQGEFHLLVTDPTRVDTRLMKYDMTLTSEEGKTYVFNGTKDHQERRNSEHLARHVDALHHHLGSGRAVAGQRHPGDRDRRLHAPDDHHGNHQCQGRPGAAVQRNPLRAILRRRIVRYLRQRIGASQRVQAAASAAEETSSPHVRSGGVPLSY